MLYRTIMLLMAAHLASSLHADVVRIALQDKRGTIPEVITIADVARVTGGDLVMRRNIAKLDLLRRSDLGKKPAVSKAHVRLRIILSGVYPRDFVVTGAEQVVLQADGAGNVGHDNRLLTQLQPALAARLRVDPSDVQLQLTRPPSASLSRLLSGESRVEFTLPPVVQAGPLSIRVRIYDGTRLLKTDAISLELRVAMQVQVARRRIASGSSILAEDVRSQRRFVTGAIARNAVVDVVGQTLQRGVQVGDVITAQDLRRTQAMRPEIVIRSRDVVEVIARRERLQIKISGAVALQQGAVGDSIRVRNPDTKKVFTARVVNPGTVEIRL